MTKTLVTNPVALLHMMVAGVIPYHRSQAHEAAILLVGGPARSLVHAPVLVEFALQIEAMDVATTMKQADLAKMFRRNAQLALANMMRV